ncbi:ketosamine-3-kinase-like isoform X2 [Neocloeon triangulifer]|nr:ketosamine-3-kinase-like isoform X2 [Neocloeon triangulifer]XP_059484160.1 ketosamine-3-kinase-like isoform X2 [Neocloeon triangulifer]
MEEKIKSALGFTKFQRARGGGGGGCINEGDAYETDQGTVFVKRNSKKDAQLMFDGEFEGLKAILETDTLKVPKPMAVVENPKGGAVLVMEYLDMKGLSKYSSQMGTALAKLHLHNAERIANAENNKSNISNPEKCEEQEQLGVQNFGFDVPTCCGYIPMDNTWTVDWPIFYARNRLEYQIKLLQENGGDRELMELWSILQLKIPVFFPKEVKIVPSLLHGDLWSGNAAETDTLPVSFDPAAFYGHHEYDLAIAGMFGGFNSQFYNAYHELIPKTKGFPKRHKLYLLFHNLNHWNHFGSGYRGSTLSIMRELVN